MRVTRFCSKVEYEMFLAGEVLTNTTDHYKGGRGGSTSVGFCFSKDKPEMAWKYLKGIVDSDVCLVLDIPKKHLKKSTGKYWDYKTNDGKVCYLTEYCAVQYSNNIAKLIRVLTPQDFATQEEIVALEIYKQFKNIIIR